MAFETTCQKDFDAVTRARGEDDFRSRLVRLELLAPEAARFFIVTQGDEQKVNRVSVDWSKLRNVVLRANCTCETFRKTMQPCQHTWAALLEIDSSTQSELRAFKALASEVAPPGKRFVIEPLPYASETEIFKNAIDIEESLTWPIATEKPTVIARFQKSRGSESAFKLTVAFAYGNLEISPRSSAKVLLNPAKNTRVKRNASAESSLLKPLKKQCTLKKLEAETFEERDAQALIQSLLAAGWRVELERRPVMPFSGAEGVLGEYRGGYALAAAFDFSGERLSLRSVAEGCLLNRGLIPLSRGRVGWLPDDWVRRIELLSRSTSFTQEGYMCLGRASLPLVKPVIEEIPGLKMDAPSRQALANLNDLSRTGQAEKPPGLLADLRAYQAEGVFWLEKLAAAGFGGILADDMGLGKTVQIISYLLRGSSLHSDGSGLRRPSLVVLPKSLVFNWVAEIDRFGPRLRVLDFTGSNRGLLRTQDYDVVLTTYHVLKNELDRLEKIEFDTIILDEAQAIKNPASQVAHAVYRLKGINRFALSGTPVENSLGDLFSLMRFTNPGLIPASLVRSLSDGRGGAPPKATLKRLSIALSPFILRRTKKQVLKELPDKCEQVLLCGLEGRQKKLYDQLRREYKASFGKSAPEKSSGKNEMKVFQALLRLRQASCHPGLIDPNQARESSAKFDALLEHLEEIRAIGHKALVFSQFTSLLELLKPHLKNAGLRFEYLDGQTRNRGAVVDRFNSDEKTTAFLISLKAGGTGLNLTTASYVFLLDPWWNPASESQAIDRAYRMGQKQKVMAYRLIAENTIEEKIMRLQAEKRALAGAVISDDSSALRSLSVKDLASLFD